MRRELGTPTSPWGPLPEQWDRVQPPALGQSGLGTSDFFILEEAHGPHYSLWVINHHLPFKGLDTEPYFALCISLCAPRSGVKFPQPADLSGLEVASPVLGGPTGPMTWFILGVESSPLSE